MSDKKKVLFVFDERSYEAGPPRDGLTTAELMMARPKRRKDKQTMKGMKGNEESK